MILTNIKKFIFPSRCVVCDQVLPFGNKLENEFLCDDCKSKLEFIKEPTCKKCGAMIKNSEDLYCVRCQGRFYKSFEYGFGLLRYNDFVKESLHRVKYGGRKEYIYFYGKCIAKAFKDKIKMINPDYIVPVPIHKKRLINRNYNQSAVLAYVVVSELKKYGIDIPVSEEMIFRTKNTQVLNKLDNMERASELNDAFYTADLSGIEKVLLIDDIYTTGSTIDSIARVLKSAGIREVYFAVISVVDNM
ncbi:MAG: ComF family protein [Lachnospiraceae bacterium]|nr:ComF family protein [Lachnospiraceae bacterium]